MNGTPFQKIPEAARTTGLSTYFLRRGVRDGPAYQIGHGLPGKRPSLAPQAGR